jgi:hypothetical protein
MDRGLPMAKRVRSLLLLAAGVFLAAAPDVRAQDPGEAYVQADQLPAPYGPPPIPPNVEAQPMAGPGGGYCYGGPHPVDTRVAAGSAWDNAQGPHTHFYAPFDMRLFTVRDGCYYFIGDPSDFGYSGQTYSYYGAHPVLETYGGGWCFMIGAHAHLWQPWSPFFVSVGPWFYWRGAYDPFFWSYWPYYSFYYRSYYPHYYGGGRFYRGGRDRQVAPPIRSVPTPAYAGAGWRGTPTGSAPGMGSAAAPGGGWRGTPVAPAAGQPGAGVRGGWTAPAPGWRGTPSNGFRAPSSPAPARVAPPVSPSGGFRSGGSGGGTIRVPHAPSSSGGGWRR